jgi:hypothetical protein
LVGEAFGMGVIWLYIFVVVACVGAGQALLHQSMLYLAIPFEGRDFIMALFN